jgi:Na+-transporting methylmalonyl-CoA/oxaloacetate decarboxylase gamma subunit
MKKLLVSMFIAVGLITTSVIAEEKKPETKKACIKTTDAKTGKEVEKCKVVKIHEKHEGTKVPDGKK